MTMPELPRELHDIRNKLIDSVYAGFNPLENSKAIQEWLNLDGWDCLVGQDADCDYSALNLQYFMNGEFSDSEFRASWLDPEEEITDEMRIAHARKLISDAPENDDGCICPTIHSYKLENPKGESVILGGIMEIHGQGGPEIYWQGLYKDKNNFLADLRSNHIFLDEDVAKLSDQDILKMWVKD